MGYDTTRYDTTHLWWIVFVGLETTLHATRCSNRREQKQKELQKLVDCICIGDNIAPNFRNAQGTRYDTTHLWWIVFVFGDNIAPNFRNAQGTRHDTIHLWCICSGDNIAPNFRNAQGTRHDTNAFVVYCICRQYCMQCNHRREQKKTELQKCTRNFRNADRVARKNFVELQNPYIRPSVHPSLPPCIHQQKINKQGNGLSSLSVWFVLSVCHASPNKRSTSKGMGFVCLVCVVCLVCLSGLIVWFVCLVCLVCLSYNTWLPAAASSAEKSPWKAHWLSSIGLLCCIQERQDRQ